MVNSYAFFWPVAGVLEVRAEVCEIWVVAIGESYTLVQTGAVGLLRCILNK